MNAIIDRIDLILKSRKEKRSDLCRGLGLAETTISTWSSRGTIPAADILNDIAIYLDTSIEYLLTGTDKSGFSQKEISLIKSYRTLSERDRKIVDNLIATLLSDDSYAQKNIKITEIKEPTPEYAPEKKLHAQNYDSRNTVDAITTPPEKKKGSLEFLDVGEIIMIPCRGITAAGSPIDIYSVPDEYIPFPKKLLPGGNPEDYFFVNLHGVSMTQAGMNDGDYVLIRRCNEPQAGKIMLVQHDGESTLKKIEMDKNGLYRLCWQDGSGRTQTIDSENWSVLGVYCWTIKGWRK